MDIQHSVQLPESEEDSTGNTLVVNFAGGPGAGKTTLCASVFAELKWLGVNCEMAPEYAKGVVWERSFNKLKNQNYIFAKQHHEVFRLCGEVDVVLTDSPCFTSIVYDPRRDPLFREYVMQEFNRFNNLNFYVRRVANYLEKGRVQTESEALVVDEVVHRLMTDCSIPFEIVNGERESVTLVRDRVLAMLGWPI